MSCKDRPGPADALAFIKDTTGFTVTHDEWRALRQVAEIDSGSALPKMTADPREAQNAMCLLAGVIARQQHLGGGLEENGDIVPWGFADEETREFMDERERAFDDATAKIYARIGATSMTEGSLAVIRQMQAWGPERAVKRARGILATPYTPDGPTPPVEVTALAETISESADDAWFESANAQHEPGEEVTLADMANPGLSGNNCFAATENVWDTIDCSDSLPEGWEHSRVEALYLDDSPGQAGSGVHWANMVTSPDGERWIIDYTARQFGGDVPYPMIATYREWLSHVTVRTKAIWGSDLTAIWEHGEPGSDGESLLYQA